MVVPAFPVLAAAAKFAGAAAVKKVAFSRVLQRVGPENAIKELRRVNGKLRESSQHKGLLEASDAADWSLDTLERSMGALKGDERVQAMWAWYDQLEKRNPGLATAVMKTYFEALPVFGGGVRWANTVLKGSSTSTSTATAADGAARSGSAREARPESDPNVAAAIEKLHTAAPEVFRDYHVVLVPKDEPVSGPDDKS